MIDGEFHTGFNTMTTPAALPSLTELICDRIKAAGIMDGDNVRILMDDVRDIVSEALADSERTAADLTADRDSWCEQAHERLKDWDDMRKRAEAAEAELARVRK